MKHYIFLILVVFSLSIHSGPTKAANEKDLVRSTSCNPLPVSSTVDDTYISDCRTVSPGTYTYVYLHIVNGGTLMFLDIAGVINFNAKSLLIEQGGSVKAGSYNIPFGTGGGKLNIGLYGAGPANIASNPNPNYTAINCQNNVCYPAAAEGKGCINSGTGFSATDPCEATLASNHSQDNSYFEGYTDDNPPFGYKVFAVSYGGSLELFGKKGVAAAYRTYPGIRTMTCPVPQPVNQHNIINWAKKTGNSWVRAAANSMAGSLFLTLDRAVDWEAGDKLILGTTDWSTSHSELVSVATLDSTKTLLTLTAKLNYPHNGTAYTVPPALNTSTGNPNTQVENRAAIGLLTRSITIKSLGATATDAFPAASDCGYAATGTPAKITTNPDCYFGAHMMVRQGFAKFQIQGVEFYQMGQGGHIGRYPVHFHMVKDASYTNAFVKDSSIWESSTRFVTVHASHNIEVSRNVGYLSMGHGFYLEDGSEINNLFCQNLGVSARASLTDYFKSQTPTSPEYRFIPPILNYMNDLSIQGSDAVYPTMFWMMNAYNELVGNQAVGVHGFGSCYWPLSSSVSGPSTKFHWARSNAALPSYQTYSELDYANFNQAGARQAPFKIFRDNGCSTAAYALMTERQSLQPDASNFTFISTPKPAPVPSTAASPLPVDVAANPYTLATADLPVVSSNFYGINYAKSGSGDLNPNCTSGYSPGETDKNNIYCLATVLDRFTTSFNWAQVNFGSVWLRPWSYVFINSAMTDQLFGGLGFVSGGSWDQVLNQQLDIVKDSIFVGSVSPADANAGQNGPSMSNALCSNSSPYPFCYFKKNGTGLYMGGFNPKRMLTIYDGPFFSDGNIFTQLNTSNQSVLTQPNPAPQFAPGTTIYNSTNQPAYPPTSSATPNATQYTLIDAAIGWKQPNGFYYPPAFAFRNSGFDTTSERHNVIDQDLAYVQGQLWGGPITQLTVNMAMTSIDSTTILNDLDGSLNGMVPSTGGKRTSGLSKRTSGLSNNSFYDAPFTVAQCNSLGTQTIPQDFVTTVVAQLQSSVSSTPTFTDTSWTGGHPAVAVYRQLKTASTDDSCSSNAQVCGTTEISVSGGIPTSIPCCRRSSLFMGAGIGAAPGLTMNNGSYYIDTNTFNQLGTPGAGFSLASFVGNTTYAFYNLYATSNTKTTYQVYVGANLGSFTGKWIRVHPHTQSSGAIQVSLAAINLGVTSYNNTTGILTVTLDNSKVASHYAFPKTLKAQTAACFPSNLCQIDTTVIAPATPQCTVSDKFSPVGLKDSMKEICNYWATRTTGQGAGGVYLNDCPRGGCLGFSFTLPASFTPTPYASAGQNLARCYPKTAPWTTGFKVTDQNCTAVPNPLPPATGNFCINPPISFRRHGII